MSTLNMCITLVTITCTHHPVRPTRDVAPRKGSQPTGRPSNAAVAPSSPSPRDLSPVPPSPVDERVASSSHRARETQSAENRAERALADTFRTDPTAACTGPRDEAGALGDAWLLCLAAVPTRKAPLAVVFTPTQSFQSPFIVANRSAP